jgi:hypothetical protein
MLLNHNTYMAYWENLAKNYLPISHSESRIAFARVIDSSRSPFQPYYYTNEFFESLRDDMHFPCLIAESTRERFANKQGMLGDYTCGILVIDSTTETNNFDDENTAVSNAKEHCGKLLAKLQQDIKEDASLGHLVSSSILIHPVGPLGNGLFGARAEFTMRASAKKLFCYDKNDWAE